MSSIPVRPLTVALLVSCLAVAAPLAAQTPDPAPAAWDQLAPAQRDQLLAPLRERWEQADADERRRMLEHARRWQAMTPEERRNARHGLHSWKRLSPEKREEARALYARLSTLSDAERSALRERWRQMTPEQRRRWAEANPAPRTADPR